MVIDLSQHRKTALITGVAGQDVHSRLAMHYGDLTDSTNLIRFVQETPADEIYNLAARTGN